jgi:hypothetical protein
MTPRYTAGVWDYDIGDMIHMPDSVTVHEQDKGPVFTGLYDSQGVPLYRHQPTVRIGFHLKD